MRLIKSSYQIITPINRQQILQLLEQIGRICWKSEDKITENSAPKFCSMLMSKNHLSVVEHISVTVKFIIDRGISHELVRHRLCSFTQESTRYVNYDNKGIEFIIPCWCKNLHEGEYKYKDTYFINNDEDLWLDSMFNASISYNSLISKGWTPQQARSVLPNSLKTELYVTANLRDWKHIFDLRCDKAAHPQMREIMMPLREEFRKELPEIFS